jgi:hypothetical protein
MEAEVTASTPHQIYQGTLVDSVEALEITDVAIKKTSLV